MIKSWFLSVESWQLLPHTIELGCRLIAVGLSDNCTEITQRKAGRVVSMQTKIATSSQPIIHRFPVHRITLLYNKRAL